MLTLTLLPMLAAAQIQSDTRIVVKVPFDFVIGSKIVPAGQLTVQRLALEKDVLTMRNRDAKLNIFANSSRIETKEPSATTGLVFHKYGNRYFLWKVKVEGSQTAYRLPESPAEAELQAQNVQATEEILLALK
jgi:hypothetical protein